MGNIRTVLTEQTDTAKYTATFETAARTAETALFYNIPETVTARQATNCPADPALPTPNDYLSVLEGVNHKAGAAITLKVMAGDKVDMGVRYWYPAYSTVQQANPLSTANLYQVLLSSLSGGTAGLSGGKTTPGNLLGVGSPLPGGLTGYLGTQAGEPDTVGEPRAFLNWLLLDEQFNYVPQGSGYLRVSSYSDAWRTLANTGLPVAKSGYLFVYLSNETQGEKVFFDNLVVQHYSGPLTEETNYYPFGLVQQGISSKAFGRLDNKYKFNEGTELNSDLNTDLYETLFRLYDAQTGRFVQVDEMADEFEEWSPYTFANDNPVLLNDPTGLAADTNWLPIEGIKVTGQRKQTGGYTMVNSPGTVLQKNPNYNEWSEDPYMRQKYINYQAWRPPSDKFNPNGNSETIKAGIEVLSWVLPWRKVGQGIKWIFGLRKLKQLSDFAKLAYASKYGIKSYKTLKALNTTGGTHVHHLIEQRFAQVLNVKPDNMLSIVVTEAEHQIFTNAWRLEIGYRGSKAAVTTLQATQLQIEAAARKIYQGYPEILKALGL